MNICGRDRLSCAVRNLSVFNPEMYDIQCRSGTDYRVLSTNYALSGSGYMGLFTHFRLFSHITLRRGVMSEILTYWRRPLYTSSFLVYIFCTISGFSLTKLCDFHTEKVLEDNIHTQKDKTSERERCMIVYLNYKCRQVYVFFCLLTPETSFW